ncbi:MAG: 2-C-methyl-D-erythritol 4-phosphate cytidylyltransferase [Oscillospiraceae bacterium]|nr:2-C-methyl-D-erythritol 4-phosphate cytidylyltransferase [Oscillospiraceae bacterium]
MRNIAIILAAGSGTRLGSSTPKQFIEIAGRTLLEYSVDAFERNANVDEIAVVTKKDYLPLVEQIVRRNAYRKVGRVLLGGKERYDSSLAAIRAFAEEPEANLMIHDCVRAGISQQIIDRCAQALRDYEAVEVGVVPTDTVVAIDSEGCISDIPVRAMMRNGQTPQCFRLSVISRAFDIAMQDPGFQATDDCGVVHKYLPEVRIKVVEGEQNNFKVTYPEDIERFERLVKGLIL